ncbi:MAG: hypothetical protein U1F66_13385 [bacterium]
MSKPSKRRSLLVSAFLACAIFAVSACESSKQPIVLTEPTPAPTAAPGPGTGPDGDCFVNFQSLLQLKVSAKPGSEALEVLDANPIAIPSFPIAVKGDQLSIAGAQFPDIVLTRLSESADLRFGGVHGTAAVGTLNRDTGEIKIDGMQFTLEVLQKGKNEPLLQGEKIIGDIELTTGSVVATGNLHPIPEQGQALNRDDKSLTLVFGITLPGDFSPLVPLNDILGGGALTARFTGKLDNLPENCGSPDSGSGPPPGQEQPEGLHVSIEGQVETTKLDFGLAPVVVRGSNGSQQIDCSDAGFRGLVSKRVTIENTGSAERTLKFQQPRDTDRDAKAPLCAGAQEFVRGSVLPAGGARCETVRVGGKDFPVGDCKLPPGASLSFPLMYVPFNFQAPPQGQDPSLDTAEFSFEYGAAKPFQIALSGRTIADVRDVFRVSKVNNGVISPKEIRNKGSLKLSLESGTPLPFTQKLVLVNTGSDTWEEVKVEFADGSAFSATLPTMNRLDPETEGGITGKMPFDLVLKDGVGPVVSDTMTIRMVKVGSRTETNPVGIEARIVINLLATIGVPKLTGDVYLQFDFLTALIDHSVIDDPLETIDYRQAPELAPEPLKLHFSDTEDPDFQNVELQTDVVDILDPSLSLPDRIKVLRIFTSRASVASNGDRLGSGDGSDKCQEPASLLVPYRNGDCSYFYHNILSSEAGLYDSESGHFTLPGILLRMQNPYHADILGRWPASNPGGNPDYLMDATLSLAFTTHILDHREIKEGGRDLVLVPDGRVSETELVMKDKRLGPECPEGYLDDVQPWFRCYLSTGDRYLQGYEVTLRAGQTKYYDVVLVGVSQFPAGGPDTSNPNLPWFLGDSGGSRIYVAIQGRLYKK